MKPPKYLRNRDIVQDAVESLLRATMMDLIQHTKLSYHQVQRAASDLCYLGRITKTKKNTVITYHSTRKPT